MTPALWIIAGIWALAAIMSGALAWLWLTREKL